MELTFDFDRGYFAGVDDALALIQTIEEQGEEFRKELYRQLIELRPPKEGKLTEG